MSDRDGRNPFRELLVLLALGLPGLVLFFRGLSSYSSARNFGFLEALGVFGGLALVGAAGYYHYRIDYRGGPYRHPLVSFLSILIFSAFSSFLVNHVLFR